MPEDEAERAVAAERGRHDLAAAHRPRRPAGRRPGRGVARWSIQFGLTEVRARRPPRLPALRLRALLAGADRRRRPGPRPHRPGSCGADARWTTPPATSTTTASTTSTATARCISATWTATGSSSMPFTATATTGGPPVARSDQTLPGFRPRKLGHVNLLTGRPGRADRVLHRRAGHAHLRLAGRRRQLVPRSTPTTT